MELKHIIAIAWKRKLTVIIVAVVAVVVAAVIAYTRTKEYQATATLAMTPNVQKGQGFVASDDLATLLSTYAAIVDSSTTKNRRRSDARAIRSNAASARRPRPEPASSRSRRRARDPKAAAAAATALSQAFEATIKNNNQLLVVQIVDPATVPTTPVAPRPPLIIAAGLFLGLGLGLALALVLERWFDRDRDCRGRDRGDLAADLGLPAPDRALRHGGRSSLIWDNPELFRYAGGGQSAADESAVLDELRPRRGPDHESLGGRGQVDRCRQPGCRDRRGRPADASRRRRFPRSAPAHHLRPSQ